MEHFIEYATLATAIITALCGIGYKIAFHMGKTKIAKDIKEVREIAEDAHKWLGKK